MIVGLLLYIKFEGLTWIIPDQSLVVIVAGVVTTTTTTIIIIIRELYGKKPFKPLKRQRLNILC